LPDLLIFPSADVGLHTQLLSYDMSDSNGINAGWNPISTIGPTDPTAVTVSPRTYQWYAGHLRWDRATGRAIGQPLEFGAVNLVAADPLLQHTHGLVAALIVEPEGSSWTYDRDSAGKVITCTSVNVSGPSKGPLFREFVLLTQDHVALTGTQNAFNFGTEPFRFRNATSINVARAVSDEQVNADPETPVFVVNAGTPVRWRLLHPGGRGNAEVFTIDGHVWREEPYVNGSSQIGPNLLSQWMGSRNSLMPNNAYNFHLERAGGVAAASGDFLYRTYDNPSYTAGWWGIMRVTEPRKDGIVITSVGLNSAGQLLITGSTVVNAGANRLADGVKISLIDGARPDDVPGRATPPSTSTARGEWIWTFTSTNAYQVADLAGKRIRATSTGGGDFTVPLSTNIQLFPPPQPSAPRVLFTPQLRTLREMTPAEIKADPVLKFRK
jgi:hypothetical protein